MYTHCIFCQKELGQNREVEHFPIGRRLAYDLHKGRLWVVCRQCLRWNLTPIEERWEALEECERAFQASRLRASTENIGIARTPDKMDLIRIGEPLRREMAFWRWGDRFGRRRKKAMVVGGAAAAVVTVGAVGNIVTGGVAFSIMTILGQIATFRRAWGGKRRIEGNNGKIFTFGPLDGLRMGGLDQEGQPTVLLPNHLGNWEPITGERALRVAALLIPSTNREGAKDSEVDRAASAIEEAGGGVPYIRQVWTDDNLRESAHPRFRKSLTGCMGWLPVEIRIALEMALHEEEERKALAGELAELEAVWEDAERIAAISDDLLLPEGWDEVSRGEG